MHINYDGKTGKFSILEIPKNILREMVRLLDESATTNELRSELYNIRDDIETMLIARVNDNAEYDWSDKEALPF